MHHPLKNATTSSSFADVTTTANDYLGKTWHIMNHTYSSAAGKSSYFYNVAKPTGNTVRMGLTSASTFDAWRPTQFPELARRRMRSESPNAAAGRASQDSYLRTFGSSGGFDP